MAPTDQARRDVAARATRELTAQLFRAGRSAEAICQTLALRTDVPTLVLDEIFASEHARHLQQEADRQTARADRRADSAGLWLSERDRRADDRQRDAESPSKATNGDGLGEALGFAAWAVRYDQTRRVIQARRTSDAPPDACLDPQSEWSWNDIVPGGLLLAQMMEAVADRVSMERPGRSKQPWRVPKLLEQRLLLVVAGRNRVTGPGSEYYIRIMEWLRTLGGGRHLTIAEGLEESKVLGYTERGPGAKREAKADCLTAYIDFGCIYKSVRTPTGPRRMWVTPGPPKAVPLVTKRKRKRKRNTPPAAVLDLTDFRDPDDRA